MAERARDQVKELLPWHRPVWNWVQALVHSQRLAHAYLLYGMAGMGKVRFTRLLVQGLLCEAPDNEGFACAVCRSCRLTNAGTHPDLHRCAPEDDKSPISVEQIRAITQFLQLKSHFGGRKIVVIEAADRMNANAANSLLKTLEEPPPNAYLLLISNRPASLPATVLSRCQRLAFPPGEQQDALDWLTAELGSASQAAILLAMAQGAPLTALEIAQEGHLDRRQVMLGELAAIMEGQEDPLQVGANWLKFGAKKSLYWLHSWLVDMARIKVSEQPPQLNNPDQLAVLSGMSLRFDMEWLLQQQELITQALNIVDSPVNTQLLLEDCLLAWAPYMARQNKHELL